LKLITLSQSKTFQSFDTIRQTACVYAISATITESTAASLISFMADTLRKKAIDKAAGAEREVVGKRKVSQSDLGQSSGWNALDTSSGSYDYTAPATDAAKQRAGWGTALKPALEPITAARRPLDSTVAENVLRHGTGAINVDGCRVGIDPVADASQLRTMNRSQKEEANGWGMNQNGSDTPQVVSPQGRWPANLILSYPEDELGPDGKPLPNPAKDEVVGLFPVTKPTKPHPITSNVQKYEGYGNITRKNGETVNYDEGVKPQSAARFFYCAKASKADRGVGNDHPTVKPIKLMQYLITLGLPPGGVLLDPFAGSGTTGRAAKELGRKAVLIEREERYCEIAARRCS